MLGHRPKSGTLSAVSIMSVALGGVICASDAAFAYRPFDGTDAAVAEPGQLEIELGPLEPMQQGSKSFLIAPDLVLNFGLTKELEAVFEGRLVTPLSPAESPVLTDAGVFIKYLLLAGVLQDKSGPSIATEFGVLLPDTTGDSNFGASWAAIVSQRWDWGTVHLNVQTQLSREQRADLFVGTIVEGPQAWKVRPVAEVFYENDAGSAQTVSGLIGAIWQVRDDLAFDVAVRHASVDGQPVNELRAGLTFAIPLSTARRMKK
jgi:hypothetical protein